MVVLSGLSVSQGAEVGITGKVTDNWQVFAGYAFTDTEIAKTTNLAELHRRLPNAPVHAITLWTTYDLTKAWTIGGGATYQSDAFVNTTNTAYVPEFWKFDAMLSYKVTNKSTIQLNVYNITDEHYYAQYYQGHAVPALGPLGLAIVALRNGDGRGSSPMMIHVPNVLSAEQVARCRDVMEKAAWVDGRVTAGHQSAKVKNNLQLPETAPEARELGGMVIEALARSNLFMSAVLPKQVFPPLFNRYDAGMTFGAHVDNAIRGGANSGMRIRTDVSSTLFISGPEDYDGGELVVDDTYGSHSVKLPAGDMIVYPSTSLHHVTPITRGSRIASFFWTQSMIRDESKRSLLFDLDMAIIKLGRDHPQHASVVELTAIYHNLLRQWAEL